MNIINGSIIVINFMAFVYEFNYTESNSILWKYSDIDGNRTTFVA